MAKFVLTAELNLQGPKNIGAIVNQINNQLKDVKINTQIQGAASAIRDIETIKKSTDAATASANKMGYAFGVSLKRFAAFSIASRAIGLFSNKLAGAIDDAISFQNEMVRLSQITGQSIKDLKGVSDQIGDLASSLGVTSKSILSVTDILAQAGLQANDLRVAINALAKTELAPTFGKIEDTAEGAVAILAQFGKGVGALEQQLGAINKVSARFAVESEDLISVVRRTGGVFKASGGSLEELLAVFTSVRATTRESAESIATGLRTIFTRIQRPKTIEYLKQFGVQLTDLNGKFVGPYKAVQQLSEALSQFEEGDVRFIQIAEELGGYRQIGKVIPLIRQFTIAENARQTALEGANSLNEDVVTSQQSLQRQFIKTQEAFLKLIRDVSNTTSFQTMVKIGLDLANVFIKVADSIKPLIPLIGALFAVRVARGLGNFAAGIGAGFGKVVGPQARNSGGKIHAFARGGLVPGSGNRDTVPAMLSPGEFVIRKSSVNKIGAGKLAAMNENRYALGGPVSFTGAELIKAYGSLGKLGVEPNLTYKTFVNTRGKFSSNPKNKRTQLLIDKMSKARSPLLWEKFENSVASIQDTPKAKSINAYLDYPAIRGESKFLAEGVSYGDRDKIKGNNNLTMAAKLAGFLLKRREMPRSYKNTVNMGSMKIFYPEKPQVIARALRNKYFGGLIRQYADGTSGEGVDPLTPEERAIYDKIGPSGLKKYLDEKTPINAIRTNTRIYRQRGSSILKETIKQYQLEQSKKQENLASLPQYGAAFLKKDVDIGKYGELTDTTGRKFALKALYMGEDDSQRIQNDVVKNGAIDLINSVANYMLGAIGGGKAAGAMTTPNLQGITGSIFEAALRKIDDLPGDGDPDKLTFDFPSGLGPSGAKLFGADAAMLAGLKTDAKFSSSEDARESIRSKVTRDLDAQMARARGKGQQTRVAKRAAGGPAPSDTVPALLTPGEFVINKKSAQHIGYGNLNRMNKRGVAGFAKGGAVSVQKFAEGGSPTYSFNNNANVLNIDLVKKSIEELKKTFLSLRQSGLGLEQAFEGAVNFIKSSSSDTSGVIPEEAQIIIAEERKRVKEASKNEKKATSSAPQYFTNGDLDLDTALQIGQLKDSFKRLKAAGLNNSDALDQSALDINNATEKTKAYIQAEQKRIEAINSENKVPAVRNRTSPNTKSSAQPSTPAGNNQPVNGSKSFELNWSDIATEGLAAPNAEKDLNAVFVKFSVLTGALNVAGSALSDMAKNADGSSTTLSRLTDALLGMVTQVSSVVFALQSFGVSLNSQNIKAFFKSTGPNSIGNKVFGGLQRNLAAKAATPKSGIFGGITRGLAGGGSNILGVLSKVAGPLALVATSATLVSSGFNTIISSLYDFDAQLKRAIETGNAARATEIAGKQYDLQAANTTRTAGALGGAAIGAAFGSFIPIVGTVVGGIAGALIGTIGASFADTIFPGISEQINIAFGGDTKKSVMAKANADALAAKYTLELADNAKEADAATAQWQLGLISTEQAMNSWGKNASNAANAFAAEMSAIDASQANKGGITRDIFTLGGLLGESSTQRNTRIDKENADRAKQAFQGLNTEFENIMSGPLAKQLFLSGASGQEVEAKLRGQSQFSEVFKQLDAAANSSDAALSKMAKQALETARKQAEAQAKQIANQKAYFDALNVGLSNFENRARAATSAMEMIQNQSKGMSSLGRSVEFLQAATTDQAAALDPKEIQANIQTFGAELLAAGADAKSVAKAQTALTATATAQRALRSESTLETLRERGRSGQLTAQGPELTKSIIDLITKDITDEAQKTQIRSTLQGIEVDDKTLAALSVGNVDPLIQQYAKALQEGAANVALGAGTQLIKAEETLAKAMISRVEAENRASDATIKSIDIRLKADERIASLGGARVTSRQREAASIQKTSAALAGTGIGLGAGTTRDLTRASQQIAGQITTLEQKRAAGTFTQQDEATLVKLKDANAKLLEQTEERFQIAEQELETAKKKAALEKSAFEKMLSGDVEGAMEAQRGAAAARLLQGGNAGIAAMLGGKASLAGLQLLQETGASDATLQRASMTIGSAYGISPALADAFAGTTPEEKAAKQRAIDLANVQKTQAAGIETVAGAELQTQIDLEARQQQAMQSMRTGQPISVGTATIPTIPAAAPAVPGVPTVPAAVSPAAVAAATTPPQAVSMGVGAGFINEQGISDKAKKAREAFVKGNSYGGIGRALANTVGTPTGSAAGVPAGATGMGISPEVMTKFTTSVESFSAAVNKLEGLKINIKIDPTNVNVNFNTGGSFIGSLTEGAKAEIGSIVSAAIKGSRVGQDGNIIPGNSSPLGTSV